MAIRSGFFNSVDGDRKYDASRFAEYFASFIGNGVFPNPSDCLQVISNNDMTITVRPGKAWINGYILINDDDYILEIEPADGVLNRIDRIVARYDVVDREIRLEVKKGQFSSNPVAPNLQRDADAYELALADVYVTAGAISITQANITDLRLNSELCGIVHGTVEQVDTTTLFAQYQAWYQQTTGQAETDIETIKQQFQDDINQFLQDWHDWFVNITGEKEEEFDTWFDGIKEILNESTAANLLNLIENHKNDKNNPHNVTTEQIGAETPTGAQEKANQAEANAKAYTDQEVSTVANDLASHKNDKIYQGEVHGMKFVNEKLQVFNGKEWIELKGGGKPVGIAKNISAKGDDRKVLLNWTDPDDVVVDGNVIAKWKSTNIVRKEGSPPLNEEDGVLVAKSGVRNQYETTPFVDRGVQNDIEYFYGIFPQSEDEIVTVSEKEIVSAIPTAQKIYGVRIDKNNSNPETRVTYIGNAVGFQPMRGNNGNFSWGSWKEVFESFEIRPCVLKNGVVQYYLNPNNFTKKADGSNSNLTGADGDVMIEFGKTLWWKWTDEGDTYTIEISDKEFDGAVKHAFEIEEGYNLVPYYPLLLTQILFVIFFKSTNSQTALGRGYVDGNSNYISTGNTNNKGMFYGSENGSEQIKFLGIEDYWGNKLWWIDGLGMKSNYDLAIGKGNFNDSGSGYQLFTSGLTSDMRGYIDSVQGGNEKGFILKSNRGSETTYYADYTQLTKAGVSTRVARFGGSRKSGSDAGFAHLNLNLTSSEAFEGVGARLFCASNGKIYIGAYLGTSVSGKLRSISGTAEPTGDKTIGTFRDEARANN